MEEKPDLKDLLIRQCDRELRLRRLRSFNSPEIYIEKEKELIEKGKQELSYYYSDEEIEKRKKGIYLKNLEFEIDEVKAERTKPNCIMCRLMYEYPDGRKFERNEEEVGLECSVYGKKPEEMLNEEIALCDRIERIHGSEEQDGKRFNIDLDTVLEFKREVEAWK